MILTWTDAETDPRDLPVLERSSLGRDLRRELMLGAYEEDPLPEVAERLHGCFEPKGLKSTTAMQDYDELAEIAGEAQDSLGNYIPRDGWYAVEVNGVREIRPTPGNPLGPGLAAMRNLPSYRRTQEWLQRNHEKESAE